MSGTPSADSWQEVISSTSSTHSTRDAVDTEGSISDTRNNDNDRAAAGASNKWPPEVIVSSANVEGGVLWLRVRGGLMLFFVMSVWIFGIFSPLVVMALIWHGGLHAYTALAGMIAVTAYPYLVVDRAGLAGKGKGKNDRDAANEAGSWLAFRHAIPEWGQYWHRSCGRVYESEGPESWDDMPPTVFCYHPHGVFTQGYILNGSLHRELPKIAGLLATSLYHAPVFRLFFGRWAGASAPASRKEFLKQMTQGNSFGIIPGGFQEAAITQLGTDRVWMKQRKGFVKYALQYGYRLRPVFTFGECNTYWNIQVLHSFRSLMSCVAGVLGAAVVVGLKEPSCCASMGRLIKEPSRDDVNKWHGVYIKELKALYERHKGQFAPNPLATLEVW